MFDMCCISRANDLSCKYRYKVSYSGVGDPPKEHEHLGHCSQMAVFVRLEDCDDMCWELKPNAVYEEVYFCGKMSSGFVCAAAWFICKKKYSRFFAWLN